MLTTLRIGIVLAFLLTGLILGAFTRSENVKGSPILMILHTILGRINMDQVDLDVNSPDVREENPDRSLMNLV